MGERIRDSVREVLAMNGYAKLHDYAALDTLDNYLLKIEMIAADYDVVSAAERRCYNIVSYFLPHINIVSNNALLLMYKEFAQSYMECGRLPKALICDDLAIHGRGLSKFLYQFESLIIDELVSNKCLNTSDDYLRFHMLFTNSITIYIYGKSAAPLLFHERYLSRIQCEKVLYPGRLRDLSMQLSDFLRRLKIANTAFAYSYRSNVLKDVLIGYCKHGDKSSKEDGYKWRFIEWDYNNERMYLAVRFHGKEKIESISTIRYFPAREPMGASIITSYSILGSITEDTLNIVCNSCAEVLSRDGCGNLASILLERSKVLRSAREQLLSTLLSVLDFVDFCSYVSVNPYEISKDFSAGDLLKIARNYSRQEQVFEELKTVAFSVNLQENIRKVFAEKLYVSISPLIDIDISECEEAKLTPAELERSYRQINDIVANEVYAIGASAEMEAARYNDNLVQFQVEDYQSVKSVNPKSYRDGVVPFTMFSDRFMKALKKKEERSTGFYVYCYVASLIAMMDYGVMGLRIAATQYHEPIQMTTIVKAGEMATFYIPRKYALFIPAFAAVEENNYGKSAVLEEMVLSFIERHLKNFDAHSELLDPMPAYYRYKVEAKIGALFGESQYENYEQDIKTLYRCGQSFRGWNFPNLTHQDNLMYYYLQQKLIVLAQNFN